MVVVGSDSSRHGLSLTFLEVSCSCSELRER